MFVIKRTDTKRSTYVAWRGYRSAYTRSIPYARVFTTRAAAETVKRPKNESVVLLIEEMR